MDEVTAGDAERFAEYLVQDMKISPRRRNGVIETCRVMFERAGELEGLGGGLVEDFAEVTDEECGVPVHHGDAVIWRVRNLGEGIPRDVDADADFLCGHVSGLSTRTMPGARGRPCGERGLRPPRGQKVTAGQPTRAEKFSSKIFTACCNVWQLLYC